jgi:hypothetical protein
MAANMVVKRTFIEFPDEKLNDEVADHATRGRGRAWTESHLDLRRDMEEDCRPWPDLENSGLSDDETETAQEDNQDVKPDPRFYETETTNVSDTGPRSRGQSASWSHSSSNLVAPEAPWSLSAPEDTGPRSRGQSASWSHSSSNLVAPEEENSEKSLATLLAENMRLASENQLLRENARLVQENTSLRSNTDKTHAHADPSPQQIEQLIMNCGPTPATYFEESHQMPMQSMQPMQLGGYAYAVPQQMVAPQMVAPQMMMYGAYMPDCDGNSRRRRRQRGLDLVDGAACARAPCAGPAGDSRTTVMLRNLPNNYTRPMVLHLLDTEGFKGKYDFFYLPIDFKTNACLGYAFINLTSAAMVDTFWQTFDGFSRWVLPSRKVCGVTWSSPHQGLEAHVDRYRNSPVMHSSVPEEYRPLVFVGGQRVPFPGPTREPKAPRMRSFVEEK